MKFKLFLINFILFVHKEHIQEDWDEYTTVGKYFCYPAWVVESICIWLISPIFLPEYFFKTSPVYKLIDGVDPRQAKLLMKEYNKAQQANFLNAKYQHSTQHTRRRISFKNKSK